jgi:hypothetical protein
MNRPFANRADDTRLAGANTVSGFGGGQLGTLLRPIATPLGPIVVQLAGRRVFHLRHLFRRETVPETFCP